jgi:hypothetical protein
MKPRPQTSVDPGPPVEWNACLRCGKKMEPNEERFRVEKGGKVGVGHKEGGCPNG